MDIGESIPLANSPNKTHTQSVQQQVVASDFRVNTETMTDNTTGEGRRPKEIKLKDRHVCR